MVRWDTFVAPGTPGANKVPRANNGKRWVLTTPTTTVRQAISGYKVEITVFTVQPENQLIL